MDLAAPLKPEVLRPLTTLIVPGTIATGPFVLVLGHHVPPVALFWTEHPKAFTVLLVIAVVAAGFIIEDLGTVIEYLIDRVLNRIDKGKHNADWNAYLKLRLNDEVIAQRYLRLKFTQLKFELAMALALPIFWFGIRWLQIIKPIWSSTGFTLISVFLWIGAALMLGGAVITAKLLGSTRALILEAMKG